MFRHKRTTFREQNMPSLKPIASEGYYLQGSTV
jgi:hypothetical protein